MEQIAGDHYSENLSEPLNQSLRIWKPDKDTITYRRREIILKKRMNYGFALVFALLVISYILSILLIGFVFVSVMIISAL